MLKSHVLANSPKQEFSRGEVRRMLGVTERQLRSWERLRFIASHTRFTFSDLIALRTLQKLRENRIPPSKISRALESLKQRLSHVKRPLEELKIFSDGRRIAVQIAGQRMEALTGQWLFNFEAAELGSVASIPPAPVPNRTSQAEHWFQVGLKLEETGAPVDQAVKAYQSAVALNPHAAGAWVNLGTICYRQRKLAEAEQYYSKAIEADPGYPLAHFNLGNLFDEKGDLAHAQQCYEQALRLSPSYGDAHFNLALLCEKRGDVLKAVHHWRLYLKLDPASSWSETARRELERLRQATVIRPAASAPSGSP
jgi:tetratricopeptide (TPR) repeat protein